MITIVILAAGSSSRMGEPKQNLIFGNNTLLQRIVIEAKSITTQVIVVIGANKEKILPTLQRLTIDILDNPQWSEGMATSIVLAVKQVLSSNNPAGIIFLLCDQPHVNAELLSDLIAKAAFTEKGIIACGYNNTIGVPAYFKTEYFPELLKLKGEEGARKLFKQFPEDVEIIHFPLGGSDIDTPEDFKKLLSG